LCQTQEIEDKLRIVRVIREMHCERSAEEAEARDNHLKTGPTLPATTPFG